MSVLVVVECDKGEVKKSSLEVASYGAEVAAMLGTTATAVAVGEASEANLASLGEQGISKVLYDKEPRLKDFANNAYTKLIATAAEQEWFRLLTSVQGVGGRVALGILSALDPAELHRAVASGDKAMVARAQGVGPKLAMRIVNELKDRTGGAVAVSGGLPVATAVGVGADAASALLNLGFRPAEASSAVAAAEEELGTGATLDALVRLALRKAAK